jgi:hypothetical protein
MKIRRVVFASFLRTQYAFPFQSRVLSFRAQPIRLASLAQGKLHAVENGAAWDSRDIDGKTEG